MSLRCEQDKGNFRWATCRIARRNRDDRGDVIARCAGRGYTACDHRRSPFGFHSTRSVSFHYGQGRRLQSSQATRRWVDDSWSTRCWRNCRSDLWIVLAAQSCASFSALDHVDIRFVADRCVCNRALAGFGHELHWPAHRRCASGHACRFRAVRFSVRTNTGGWFSISCARKNRGVRTTNSVPRSDAVLLCWARSELRLRVVGSRWLASFIALRRLAMTARSTKAASSSQSRLTNCFIA